MSPFWPDGELVVLSTDGEQPTAFHWRRRRHRIQQVSVHWRVHTTWWDGAGGDHNQGQREIWRDYWELTTDTGLLCVLYHDLIGDTWHLERVYE